MGAPLLGDCVLGDCVSKVVILSPAAVLFKFRFGLFVYDLL